MGSVRAFDRATLVSDGARHARIAYGRTPRTSRHTGWQHLASWRARAAARFGDVQSQALLDSACTLAVEAASAEVVWEHVMAAWLQRQPQAAWPDNAVALRADSVAAAMLDAVARGEIRAGDRRPAAKADDSLRTVIGSAMHETARRRGEADGVVPPTSEEDLVAALVAHAPVRWRDALSHLGLARAL